MEEKKNKTWINNEKSWASNLLYDLCNYYYLREGEQDI